MQVKTKYPELFEKELTDFKEFQKTVESKQRHASARREHYTELKQRWQIAEDEEAIHQGRVSQLLAQFGAGQATEIDVRAIRDEAQAQAKEKVNLAQMADAVLAECDMADREVQAATNLVGGKRRKLHAAIFNFELQRVPAEIGIVLERLLASGALSGHDAITVLGRLLPVPNTPKRHTELAAQIEDEYLNNW